MENLQRFDLHANGTLIVHLAARVLKVSSSDWESKEHKKGTNYMGRRLQPQHIVLTLMALMLICNGCTTSLLLSSMSAAQSGATHISGLGGKIESYQAVTFENTIKATRLAAKTLSLDVNQEAIDADRASFQYADKSDRRADVVIEQRTATMTYLMVNTGWFGAHGMGHLLIRQILQEISDAGDLLE